MTIHTDTAAVLDVLGPNGERWCKGWGDWNEPTCTETCLFGAIRRCSPVPGDAYLIAEVAKLLGWGTTWNDDEDTTWADVRARIDAGLDVTDADLEHTYGPQWREIVAMVRRAAVLTEREARELAAARAAGRAAIGAAAIAAARAAIGAAAGAVAMAAAMAAAMSAGAVAMAAAMAAAMSAGAVATRHLIGQHGYTQKHYDTLLAPWRQVIGFDEASA